MKVESFIHRFKICDEEIQLNIEYRLDGYCETKSLAKDFGYSGGSHGLSREEYIKKMEMEYRYQYNFNKHGYQYAKQNI